MKFQDFKFNNIDEMLDSLPENQKQIVEYLRELVFETLDGVQEKLSYNVPFYKIHRNICFIWPGAVPWGSKFKKGVEFGFNNGYLLSDANYLEKGNRKYIYIKTFFSLKEINSMKLKELLRQAMEIDDLKYKRM